MPRIKIRQHQKDKLKHLGFNTEIFNRDEKIDVCADCAENFCDCSHTEHPNYGFNDMDESHPEYDIHHFGFVCYMCQDDLSTSDN